jgi:hypothetical protein
MNMKRLNIVFDAACNAQAQANSEMVTLWSCRSAGLKAVVEELRDEFAFDSNVYDQFAAILASGALKEKL